MNATDPKIETPQLVATGDSFGGTLIGELMRLDKIISDCAESILLAERLKARGGRENYGTTNSLRSVKSWRKPCVSANGSTGQSHATPLC